MKYRHAHHAGNFADVVKHLVLIELLEALKRKPAPFLYLETHAGRGRYVLPPPRDRTGTEFEEGFGRLAEVARPGALGRYVQLVNRLGSEGDLLTHYPGSPAIAASLLREHDRVVLFEAQPAEAAALQKNLGRRRGTTVHAGDGYEALKSQLPPLERRGLVLIDPPYEAQAGEFDRIVAALDEGLQRWASGVYAIWYPIKREEPIRRFHGSVVRLGVRRVLCAELCIYPPDSRASLNGCGMLVLNAPWQIDNALHTALPALHEALGGRPGTAAGCSWLIPD